MNHRGFQVRGVRGDRIPSAGELGAEPPVEKRGTSGQGPDEIVACRAIMGLAFAAGHKKPKSPDRSGLFGFICTIYKILSR